MAALPLNPFELGPYDPNRKPKTLEQLVAALDAMSLERLEELHAEMAAGEPDSMSWGPPLVERAISRKRESR